MRILSLLKNYFISSCSLSHSPTHFCGGGCGDPTYILQHTSTSTSTFPIPNTIVASAAVQGRHSSSYSMVWNDSAMNNHQSHTSFSSNMCDYYGNPSVLRTPVKWAATLLMAVHPIYLRDQRHQYLGSARATSTPTHSRWRKSHLRTYFYQA